MKTLSLWTPIDRFLGCDGSTDLQQTLRARLAVAFSGMMGLIAIVNVTVLSLTENGRAGMVELGLVGAAGFAACGLLGAWLRRPSITMIMLGVLTAALYAGAIYGNRGDVPPAFAYTPCVLLGFYQFWGPRSLIVTVPAFSLAFGAVLALSAGFDNPDPYPFGALTLALGLSCIWLLSLAAVFNSVQDVAARQLRRANDDLATALAESQSAQRAKSEFLANVGHEVRTPLNGVLGMADVMHRVGGLAPDQAERLDLIRDSGQTLLELLNEILDQSKIETGQVVAEKVDFNLLQVIEKTAASWRPEAESRGLDLHVDLDGIQLADVKGDPLRLRQILNNLVSNALKFTESGHVMIQLSQAPDGADWLTTLEVIDTGTGVPEAKRDTIFEAFHQADASITRRYGGTGLGLSISRQLARLMGGELRLRGNPGGGSCFSLTLPLAPGQASAGPQGQVTAVDRTERVDLAGAVRILSVDDVATNHIVLRALLEQVFSSADLTIDIANSGQAAIDLTSEHCHDLIFMDIQMPEMDGATAARRIRDAHPDRDIAIIAVSALEADQSARILPAGLFDHILPKPTSIEALQAVVLAWQRTGTAGDAARATA
ncbi:ATP-binding protein [Maricaulis maris]|uniref:ATP-binding protein n=1 Tax=Maricaulis maris TaxID=74318 RepID=UPI003B8CC518